jgi:hypothetical protein
MTHTAKTKFPETAQISDQKFIGPPPILKESKRKVSTKLRLGEQQASKDLVDKQISLTQLQ